MAIAGAKNKRSYRPLLRGITSEAGPRLPSHCTAGLRQGVHDRAAIARHRRSLYADVWEATAADLAERNNIIYPIGVGRWGNLVQDWGGQSARYSLIASIRAADRGALRTESNAQIAPEITGEAMIEG